MRRNWHFWITAPSFAGALTVPSGADVTINQTAKFNAADKAPFDLFGSAVALEGDVAVVAAYFDDGVVVNSGSAYIFERTSGVWVQSAKFTAPDPQSDDWFGWSADISGDTVVIGAPHHAGLTTDAGAAYVYARAGASWALQAVLSPGKHDEAGLWGYSVAISGDTIVVGASTADEPTIDLGAAFVFERRGTQWSPAAVLSPQPLLGTSFASSVDIDGDTILVGAPGDPQGGPSTGAGYVFVRSRSGWVQQAKFKQTDPGVNNSFGFSVSLSGDVAILAAGVNNGPVTFSGAAYVFRRTGTTWAQEQKLVASDPASFDGFGLPVKIDGNVAIVSAYDEDPPAQSGAAYVYARANGVWSQVKKLKASDAAANDHFGFAAAIDGSTALLSAYADDVGGMNTGSVYEFTFAGTGACCGTEGCGIESAVDCADQGGEFAGFNTGCKEVECRTGCVSDFNGDGVVDGADLGLLLGMWTGGNEGRIQIRGTIDEIDLELLLSSWGRCSP
jgi:hypothetical protein